MSTKKTATKKVARKRSIKTELEVSNEEVPSTTEVAPKKKTARKAVKRTEEPVTAPAPTENTERKEPVQGVRDVRTQKSEEQQPSAETASSQAPQQDDFRKEVQSENSDQENNGQNKGRNRRGRRNRDKGEQQQPQQQPQQAQIDDKELSKKAWKVFIGEVNEEGLALIGDKEGRELAKRSFRLAEIFLEEQGRRTAPKQQPQQRRQRQERPAEEKRERVKPAPTPVVAEAPVAQQAQEPKGEE
ncbi:hypothetical protein [Rubritalea sp.]|uniref:hypothetical protein n=1 Tax=Rubritalea sp. TaxID=2109375 RepID=UPI003EF5FAFA